MKSRFQSARSEMMMKRANAFSMGECIIGGERYARIELCGVVVILNKKPHFA